MSERRRKELMTGALFMAVGGWLGAQQVLHWRALDFGRLWPIIVIAAGASKVWYGVRREDGTAGWGVGLMLMGTILLLHTQDVLAVARSWPLFIVAHGVGLSLGGVCNRRNREVRDDQ